MKRYSKKVEAMTNVSCRSTYSLKCTTFKEEVRYHFEKKTPMTIKQFGRKRRVILYQRPILSCTSNIKYLVIIREAIMCAFEFMPPMLKEEAFMVQYCFEIIKYGATNFVDI